LLSSKVIFTSSGVYDKNYTVAVLTLLCQRVSTATFTHAVVAVVI